MLLPKMLAANGGQYSDFSYGSFGGRASAIIGMSATSRRRNAAARGAAGVPPDAAVEWVRSTYCRRAVQEPSQQYWIDRFSERLTDATGG